MERKEERQWLLGIEKKVLRKKHRDAYVRAVASASVE